MSETPSEAGEDQVTRHEVREQEPKELPRREGTFDRIVEEAEADPEPEEVAATDTEPTRGGDA